MAFDNLTTDLARLNTSETTRAILRQEVDKVIAHKKSLPSQPPWTAIQLNYGYWDGDRAKLLKLAAFYQNIPEVHGAIQINAKGVAAAKPTLMKIVNAGAKNLFSRKLKRLGKLQYKRLLKQFDEPNLHRKSVGEEDELVEVTEHPALAALRSRDQDQNFHSLITLSVVSVCIYGICFWRKIKDALGNITSYQYLPVYNVTPQRGPDGIINGWYYCSTYGDAYAEQLFVEKEDMVVTRWSSISDPHAGGDSPLLAALKKIDISGKWADHQDWVLNNRGRPDAVLTVDDETGSDEAIKEEKRYNDKFRGPGNGRIFVTTGKFTPVVYPLTDLASLKFDEALKEAIYFVLGIPKSFSTNDSNKATMAASMDQWARQSLAPIVALLESTLNDQLQDFETDGTYLWVFQNVIPADRKQELEEETFELEKWTTGITSQACTKDEYRTHVLGLEPLVIKDVEPVAIIDEVPNKELEDEEDKEAEEVATDKSFNLLNLNVRVSKGFIDRATGIKIVAHSLRITEDEARGLVTKAKKIKKQTPVNPSDCPSCGASLENRIEGKCMKCMKDWPEIPSEKKLNCEYLQTKSIPSPTSEFPNWRAWADDNLDKANAKLKDHIGMDDSVPGHYAKHVGVWTVDGDPCDFCLDMQGKHMPLDTNCAEIAHPNCQCQIVESSDLEPE